MKQQEGIIVYDRQQLIETLEEFYTKLYNLRIKNIMNKEEKEQKKIYYRSTRRKSGMALNNWKMEKPVMKIMYWLKWRSRNVNTTTRSVVWQMAKRGRYIYRIEKCSSCLDLQKRPPWRSRELQIHETLFANIQNLLTYCSKSLGL